MQWKFTPKFQEAYARALKAGETDGEEALKRSFRDEMLALGHEERVRNLYRIKDKLSSKPLQFHPNAAQEFYLQARKGRDIILKPRQLGFTTLAGVRNLDHALWEPNTSTGIMAHHQGTVGTIFTDLVKFTYNWFVRDWGNFYNPTQKNDNATELAFKDDGLGRIMDSSMRVLYDFRGKTINYLHVSEASRVEDARLLGSLQGVPANGEVVLESTANGRGGNFYRLWQEHRNSGQSAPFKGHFIPWFAIYPEVPENWIPEPETVWTEYETKLMQEHDLQPHHVLWRRWCIITNCNGDADQFENEYPSNDNDCFFTGEFSVFPATILKAQDKNTREPMKVGFLLSEEKKITLHEDTKGVCLIWKMPDVGRSYVIGSDPSGGVGKDKGAAYVKDRKSKETVACIWGDIEPADLARELYKLGHFYNKAWINVEVNNHGHTVLHELKERGYPHLYKRIVLDEMTKKPTSKVGFLTTNESKLRITEQLKSALKDGDLVLLHKASIDELSTFIQVASKSGRGIRREAAQGAHDDLVMALALCQEMDAVRGNTDFTREAPEANAMRDANFDPITGMPY